VEISRQRDLSGVSLFGPRLVDLGLTDLTDILILILRRINMKNLRKACFLFLIVSLLAGVLYSPAIAKDKWPKNDANTDEWNAADLFIARPLGIIAGVAGTGVFVLALPFTIPTGSVDKSAKMFIVEPFRFSFVREFPDEDM
jgi:hypothetical protein